MVVVKAEVEATTLQQQQQQQQQRTTATTLPHILRQVTSLTIKVCHGFRLTKRDDL